VIMGFEAGLDLISLAGIDANSTKTGDQAFAFIGTAAFGGQAGQVRLVVAGSDCLLQGDVNGDGVADFEIQVAGVVSVAVNDLVL